MEYLFNAKQKGRSVNFVIVTTLVGLFVAVTGAFLQFLAFYAVPLFSRRSLTYEYDESVPVINEQVKGGVLTVAYGADALADPHVVHFKLVNTGKRDIPSGAFDQAMSLQFDFGVKVIAVLHSSSRPESLISLKTVFSDQVLSIGPSLIPRASLVEYVLLVDGPCGEIECRSPLEEVRVRESRRGKDQRLSSGNRVKPLVTYACIAVAVWWVLQEPANAAQLIHNASSLMNTAAKGFANFVTSI